MNPGGGTEFRGRTTELEQLCRWANEPTATAAVLTGEAGIGKSALVTAFAAAASARCDAPVVVGHCAPVASAALPFIAWTEVLRTLLGRCTEDQGKELLGPKRGRLGELLPLLPDESAGAAKEMTVDRLAFFDAVREVFDRAGPLVLVVEDVHWMTRSGLELFDYLLHSHGDRLHLLATSRSEVVAAQADLSQLVREAERAGLLNVMPLGPLGRAEISAIVTAASARVLTPGTTEHIYDACGGNPYFAAELTRHYLSGAAGLPSTLSDLLTRSQTPLPADALAVVNAVAVGGRVSHQLLATVLGLPPARIERATAVAVAARSLEVTSDGTGYGFRHELSRQAAYAAVLPGERLRLHAAYAAALAATAGDDSADLPMLAALADHNRCAGAEGEACRWSLVAATAAESAAAFGEALRLFRQALELPVKASGLVRADRLDVLMRASRVAELAGDHQAALSFAEEALLHVDANDDPVRAALLEERRTWCGFLTGTRPPPTHCQRALDLVPAHPPSLERAAVLTTHARLMAMFGRAKEAVPIAEEAVEISIGLGADRERSRALTSLGAARSFLGDVAGATTALEQARELAVQTADVDGIASAYELLSEAKLLWSPDLDGAAALALAGHEATRRLGVVDGGALVRAAQISCETGDWSDALELAAAAADYGGHAAVLANAVLTVVSTCRGNPTPAAVTAMEQQASTWEEPSAAALSYSEMLAEVQLTEGRPEAAVETVDIALRHLDEDPVSKLSGRLFWLGMRGQADRATAGVDRRDAAMMADAHAGAARLRELAAAVYPDPFNPAVSRAPTAAAVGLTWRAEQARLSGTGEPSAWAKAAAEWAALPRPYPQAYCLFRQAEAAMSRAPSRGEASPVLRAALTAAHRLGAAPLEGAVSALARRARVEVEVEASRETTKSMTGPTVVLSAREQQILRLIADGWTNRSIAQRLVISTKTVDSHVSHLLTKLNAHDRVTAATRASRLGLLV